MAADLIATFPEIATNTGEPLALGYEEQPDGSYAPIIAGGGSGGSSAGGGNTTYSNLSGDFVATPNTGAKTITLSAYASSVLSAVLTAAHFASAIIKVVHSDGSMESVPTTSIAFAANVLTLSDKSANFAAGDSVAVILLGPDKGFDEANDQAKVTLSTGIAGEDLAKDVLKVEQRFNYATITTATTTTPKTGAGFIHALNILGGTLGTITVYDNTAASGTPICPAFTPTAAVPCPPIILNQSFATGLTIVTAAATILNVAYN